MDLFKEQIKALSPIMKSMGFNKKGNSFYLEMGKNYGIVTFQKSRESTKEVIKFTVNFGIYSYVLWKLQYDYNNLARPEVDQCHWQARVGVFMPGSPDYWFNASTSHSLSGITSDVVEIIKSIIIPEINKRLFDEGLINSWMHDIYAGTTEISRFKYLTILLKVKGDLDTLNEVVEKFMQQSKGKVNESKAIEHLKEIGYSK